MDRQGIVRVRGDAMVLFPGCMEGIHVNDGIFQVTQVVQKLMLHFLGDLVAFFDREF